MSDRNQLEIPDQIEEMMQDEEIENMRSLDGWATGIIVERMADDRSITEIERGSAWIELFNGEGRAGHFGGVRFMAVWDNYGYEEAYAYPDQEAARNNEPCWYVDEWIAPEDPDVGKRHPDGIGVAR